MRDNTIEKLIAPKALYRTELIPLPTPEFFVFYNGNKPYPEEKILRLSDAYLEKTDPPMLELVVKVININLPANHPLLEACRPMYEYSWFIQKIKEYQERGKSRDDAVIFAMADCKTEGIPVDFLREHGTEAVNMLFTEFNMEDILEVRYEEGVSVGIREGEKAGRTESTITSIRNIMKNLHKLADEAMDILDIPREERPLYREKV